MSINKVNAITKSVVFPQKNIVKEAVPIIGSLSVLAGSSMGPTIDPGTPHVPGTSVTDPFIDQLKHTGDMLLDTGSAIGEGVLNGFSSLSNVVLDAGVAAIDGVSDLSNAALKALDKLLDTIG